MLYICYFFMKEKLIELIKPAILTGLLGLAFYSPINVSDKIINLNLDSSIVCSSYGDKTNPLSTVRDFKAIREEDVYEFFDKIVKYIKT